MTEEEVYANPLVRCAACGNNLSLLPELHRFYQPVMQCGQIYHLRCVPPLNIPERCDASEDQHKDG